MSIINNSHVNIIKNYLSHKNSYLLPAIINKKQFTVSCIALYHHIFEAFSVSMLITFCLHEITLLFSVGPFDALPQTKKSQSVQSSLVFDVPTYSSLPTTYSSTPLPSRAKTIFSHQRSLISPNTMRFFKQIFPQKIFSVPLLFFLW